MEAGKPKSTGSLQRAVAKYETKLARAANPTQRTYAAGMLRMARDALAKSSEGSPEIESDGPDVVTLRSDEYKAH